MSSTFLLFYLSANLTVFFFFFFTAARVEISFLLNPQTYHGPLRISTGMEISRAVVALERRASEITVPFKVIHGKQDRITSPEGSQEWFSRCMSKDQTVELWDGYEVSLERLVLVTFALFSSSLTLVLFFSFSCPRSSTS